MIRSIALAATWFVLAAPALAGRQHKPFVITKPVDKAADMTTSLDDADPRSGWVHAEAQPETAAAKTKADILIESLADGTVVLRFDPAVLDEDPWGTTSDGGFLIYALDTVADEGDDPNGGVILIGRDGPFASIEYPSDATWSDVAVEHLGYLFVDARDGSASAILPSVELGLTGIEPDEID
jgi:hypothetical protein